MISVMIIEDEEKIRKILKKMIEKTEGFQVVAEAGNFAEAVQEFSVERPQVVFVDVDLNGDSGIECAKVMSNIDPDIKIIFATAHSEYMANAFELYALDYLVKPFDLDRVTKTLRRIKESLKKEEITTEPDTDKLLVKGKEQMFFLNKKDIVMIERVENSTIIITTDGNYKSSVSLSELEEKLPANFMRCHKSYIINVDMISKTEAYGRWTYVVKFKNVEDTALITAQKYDELKNRFE